MQRIMRSPDGKDFEDLAAPKEQFPKLEQTVV
jgi:hypothetical protein